MNVDTILKLLQNSGFHGLRADAEFIYMEDPSCILRSFETFAEYAWFCIMVLTGVLLCGWAISMLRGAKNDIFTNLRNLIIIFGVLTLTRPILNLIYGDDLFARGCKTIAVSIEDTNKLLDARNAKLGTDAEQHEQIDIYDSGATDGTAPDTTTISSTPDQSTNATTDTSEVNAQPDTDNTTPEPVSPTVPTTIDKVAVAAAADGKNVIYTMPDGARVKRVGGTRAWRNTNPGNIRYSEFARRIGAIGQAGGFAVFPTEEIGMYAIEALLRTDSYNKLTVAGAISRYAPPSENNTSAYHRQIEKLTGLSINKRMADLTAAELTRVASAIRHIEGWREGSTERI